MNIDAIQDYLQEHELDGWLLADFGDIVLHVFSMDQREYYSLDELWHEGKVLLHLQ